MQSVVVSAQVPSSLTQALISQEWSFKDSFSGGGSWHQLSGKVCRSLDQGGAGETSGRSSPLRVKASSPATTDRFEACLARRDFLASTAAAVLATASSFTAASPAQAAGLPKGFSAVEDTADGYRFLYPFGWQQVSVTGQDIVYKDIIEPLESVSVNIIKTDKRSLEEFGTADEVVQTLVEKVLTSPTQKPELLSVKQRVTEGKMFYSFEFLSRAPNYTRHALATVGVSNGKFFTITTGANERRWKKMEPKLRTIVDSFYFFY